MEPKVRTGKILICDGIFAIVMIFAMSSCEQTFNTQKVASPGSEQTTTLASLCKKF